VNWLTHAKNAVRMDAEIDLKAVERLLGTLTAAQPRLETMQPADEFSAREPSILP
jgi:hypothetical protein